MYGKEIAEKPEWLNIEKAAATPDYAPEKVFFNGGGAFVVQEHAVFAEDEAFKDFSKLLNRGDVGRDLAEELRALVAKYRDWNTK